MLLAVGFFWNVVQIFVLKITSSFGFHFLKIIGGSLGMGLNPILLIYKPCHYNFDIFFQI
jgi:hypothetical protein